jgi:S-methylmethionine-dependent homocysteine/selenocysteine methylase
LLTNVPIYISTCVKPVLAILFNCSEPEAINRALQTIQVDKALLDSLRARGILLGAYANRLTPVASDWSLAESNGPQPMRKDLDPQQYYNSFVATWVLDLGVQIVGGCCGTHSCLFVSLPIPSSSSRVLLSLTHLSLLFITGITPEHIAHLSSQLRDHKK